MKNRQFIIFGCAALLCYLAKPSFDFIFMPLVAIYYIVYFLIKRNAVVFFNCLKVAIAFIPTLIYAILTNMYSGESGMGIAIDPFYIFKFWKVNYALTIIGSFAFPITVLFLLNKKNIKDYCSMICFSWGCAIISLLELSFLKEVGPHAAHGNFGWGYAISVFILFIVSMIVYIKETKNNVISRIRLSIATVIIVLHFLFGIYYFYLCWSGIFYFGSFVPKSAF